MAKAKAKVVSHEAWLKAREALLEKEKAFTRLRDELGRETRALPWERVEKDYRFAGPDGALDLGALFAGMNQLIVYHFMLGPGWAEGCKACSLLADHFDPLVVHLRQRDVAFAAVSRAPLEEISAFKGRMGWSFPWVSSADSDFNLDFQVSFTPEQLAGEEAVYNYRQSQGISMSELPGLSVFCRDGEGALYHSYSCYARGLESFLGVYRFLDVVPKGRDEAGLPFGMAWVGLHDSYKE